MVMKTGAAFEVDLLCLDAEIGFNQVEKIKVVALETAFVGFAMHSQMVKTTIIVAT